MQNQKPVFHPELGHELNPTGIFELGFRIVIARNPDHRPPQGFVPDPIDERPVPGREMFPIPGIDRVPVEDQGSLRGQGPEETDKQIAFEKFRTDMQIADDDRVVHVSFFFFSGVQPVIRIKQSSPFENTGLTRLLHEEKPPAKIHSLIRHGG